MFISLVAIYDLHTPCRWISSAFNVNIPGLLAISPSRYFWISHLAYLLGLTIHLSIFLHHLLSSHLGHFCLMIPLRLFLRRLIQVYMGIDVVRMLAPRRAIVSIPKILI